MEMEAFAGVFLVSCTPLVDEQGRLDRVIHIATDITDRKQAEEALRRERDFASSLVETAQAIVLLLDTDGRIMHFNPYMAELSGYSASEVRGKDWFTTFLPAGDWDRIRKLFKQAVENVQTRGNINPIVTKDGRLREIEWSDRTLKDADGRAIGLLSIGQDVTERRLLEEQLRQSQKMEAIGRLAGGVAHDFNNLLTAILGNSESLLSALARQTDTASAESLRPGLEQIESAGKQAAAITRQLLTFSRREEIRPGSWTPGRLSATWRAC